MVTIELNTWERVELSEFIYRECKAVLYELPLFIQARDILVLNDQERKQVGFRVDNESNSVVWDDAERVFVVSFPTVVFVTLAGKLLKFEGWPPDTRIESMLEKVRAAYVQIIAAARP